MTTTHHRPGVSRWTVLAVAAIAIALAALLPARADAAVTKATSSY